VIRTLSTWASLPIIETRCIFFARLVRSRTERKEP
jgi:hypothetical protein